MNLQPLILYFYPFVCSNCYVRKCDTPYTRGHINSGLVLACKKAGLSVQPRGITHSVLHSRANMHHFLESKSPPHLQKRGQGLRLCSAMCISGFIITTRGKREVQLVLIFFIFSVFLISKPLTVKHYIKSN